MNYRSYNRGEWTEVYVLFYLLGQKKLYKGDPDFQKISDFFDISRIFHYENLGKVEFRLENNLSEILIKRNGCIDQRISVQHFIDKANDIFEAIINSQGRSFSIPSIEDFLKSINCQTIKQDSRNVKDIEIEIIDTKRDQHDNFSFSIKSKLGQSPTIFNAGRRTVFIYRIESNNNLDIPKLKELESATKILRTIRGQCQIVFDDLKTREFTNTFYRNLILIDDSMPIIVANLLLNAYSGENNKSIIELHKKMTKDNPCGYELQNVGEIYERKIKNFLTDITLGLKASEDCKKDNTPNGLIFSGHKKW
ncbi:MAG: HpaII family restriction endonuclease [Microcystis aeruginosa W13-11]|jgi:type II restriction enzyme|nr:HpaII family restriction endonuclease [Microcystis aeruginosa W13-11]